ncbi:MAG: hypothetical protein IAE95_00045, partial [Chitinophagaceae bacterium]|nr:hypothetical protein [Chitinophagaceae bacterium]
MRFKHHTGIISKTAALAISNVLLLISLNLCGQTLNHPTLTAQFHKTYGDDYWLGKRTLYDDLCKRVLLIADTANRFGGALGGYHRAQLGEAAKAGRSTSANDSHLLTDALLGIARDL